MNNNDILRRTRYIFDFSDAEMIEIFALGDRKATREQVSNWLKREEAEGYEEMRDHTLAVFLNGLIAKKRGKREGKSPEAEKKLTHNLVLRKFKIALSLQSEDILELLSSVDFRLSKHELSSFFRQPSHRNYRECQDQVLRNFLQGLQRKLEPTHHKAPPEA